MKSEANLAVAGAIVSSLSGAKNIKRLLAFTIKNMNTKTNQADEAILDILQQMRSKVKFSKSSHTEIIKKQDVRYDMRRSVPSNLKDVTISASRLNAFDVDATNCPDLFSIFTTLGVFITVTVQAK